MVISLTHRAERPRPVPWAGFVLGIVAIMAQRLFRV